MHARYHTQITTQALEGKISPRALQVIIDASLAQDHLRGQIGHPQYHFDDNRFAESYAYMDEQQRLAQGALKRGQVLTAWQAFGRLIHAAQDFYAHSNYVRLWVDRYIPLAGLPPSGATAGSVSENQPFADPAALDPLDQAILHSPALASGRIYIWELLSWLPGLKRPMSRFLPHDAHFYMNLDTPERGPLFNWAYAAALKRTRYEFEALQARLSPKELALFLDASS
jgi:hypothetical protein